MPSTRKQKAREKCSRQSDVMSYIKNMDVMSGGFPAHGLESDHEGRNIEVDLESDRPR